MTRLDVQIEEADGEEVAEILALQKLAYTSEAELIDDYTIPPLHQTLEEIQAEFAEQVFLKVEHENEIVGSVRGYVQDGTCYIGKLIVHPQAQNQGLGTRLLKAIEGHFSEAQRYELFTGWKSVKNLYLYEKLGYERFKEVKVSDKLTLVYLQKLNKKDR
ncbi:MAG: GNAT family N-acetyltransferase [Anaerolineales bacterium]|nr:GNAT family N-acetyltransferase [Anaerolineales bacterium]